MQQDSSKLESETNLVFSSRSSISENASTTLANVILRKMTVRIAIIAVASTLISYIYLDSPSVLAIGVIALLLEICVLAYVLKYSVSRPLAKVVLATRKVAAGIFDVNLDTDRHDEIGELSRSFQTMVSAISGRDKLLEERIEERTY